MNLLTIRQAKRLNISRFSNMQFWDYVTLYLLPWWHSLIWKSAFYIAITHWYPKIWQKKCTTFLVKNARPKFSKKNLIYHLWFNVCLIVGYINSSLKLYISYNSHDGLAGVIEGVIAVVLYQSTVTSTSGTNQEWRCG